MPAPNESHPDAPSKLDQRREADENTGTIVDKLDPDAKRASNIRAYHKTQIAEARKTIAAHQAIVDQQNVILGEVEEDNEADASDESSASPIANGTDIAERFHNAFDALYTVDELKEQLAEYELPTTGNKPELIDRLVAYHNDELDEDEDNGDNPDDSNSQE